MKPSLRPWAEFLGMLIEKTVERQRVAMKLDVDPQTLKRWSRGETEPRLSELKQLPGLFPEHEQQFIELLDKELGWKRLRPPTTSPSPFFSADQQEPEIPLQFFTRVLETYATTTRSFRTWSACQLVLQQALLTLDPESLGLEVTIVVCVPPSSGNPVRSLVAHMGIGTPPWEQEKLRELNFFGAESLCGHVVSRGQPAGIADVTQPSTIRPSFSSPAARSMMAWPFLQAGYIAGCLSVISTQRDYFTKARTRAIEIFANLLALSFSATEYYERKQIHLQRMPLITHTLRKSLMESLYDLSLQPLETDPSSPPETHEESSETYEEPSERLADFQRVVYQSLEAKLLHFAQSQNGTL